jgi:hypothetical protein
MNLDAQAIPADLQTLKAAEQASTLPRLRELADAVEHAMASDRHSNAGLAAALTHQAINTSTKAWTLAKQTGDQSQVCDCDQTSRSLGGCKRRNTDIPAGR